MPKNNNEMAKLAESADEAAESLKAIANPLRLQILCHLAGGECTVHELESRLQVSQSNVSQQLAKLRDRAIVSCRREGRNLFYSLQDMRYLQIIAAIKSAFCPSFPRVR
jgi:DNA-binding transcriptional ArsR family regulator